VLAFRACPGAAHEQPIPMATATPPFHDPTRETLAPLLLRRFRLIAPSVLLGTAAFGVIHVVLGEKQLPLLLGIKLVQIVVTAASLWLAVRYPTRRVITVCLLIVAVGLIVVTAVTGIVIGNVHTNSLLYVMIALATSSFLPWGPATQTVSVLVAGAAAVAPIFATTPVYHDIWYDLVALAVAFAISIYIAREVESDTLAEYRAQAAIRALAESRAEFEGLFRSTNVQLGLFELTDDDVIYSEVNDSFARLFGATPAEINGKSAKELGFSPETVRQWHATLVRTATRGSLLIPEHCFEELDPTRWFHISLSAIRDPGGTQRRIVSVNVDVTDLKRANDDIRRLNLDLEAQVRERTALLEAANKDLESFAYSVSHDLRTPLRTIEGFAALLTHDHGSELSPAAQVQLDRIRSASQHMAQLIDDMLMLSRASRSEMRREPVDVTRLARDLAAELRAARPERDASITVEPGLIANADPQLMRIVMTNLLGNSWKYTGRRDKAVIEVVSEIYEGEDVFVVRDNGCGFDMRFVGKLFQPFQRLHAAEEFEGTGVGLATVARIVRRHGGKVWAEGAPDRGATFRFTVGESGVVNPS